jgi:hypothetical protein
MGGLFFFQKPMNKSTLVAVVSGSDVKETEVSRSHSSEEAFVMRVERRAESLERGSFFF